jgi:hypothetical protein
MSGTPNRSLRVRVRTVIRWAVAISVALLTSCTADRPVKGSSSDPVLTPPPLVDGAHLNPGTYLLELDDLSIALTVPSGWDAWTYGVLPTDGGVDAPAGTGLGFWLVDNIYADPCAFNRGLLDPAPGPHPVDLASALKHQRGPLATSARAVPFAGRSALVMEITVPSRIDFSDCWDETFLSWPQRESLGGGRSHQGPGQRDRLWILEVGTDRLVVDAAYFPKTPHSARAELWQIARSVVVDGGATSN